MLLNSVLSKSALALGVVMVLTTLPGRAEEGSLPVGERAGDQYLSPFYSWTQTLPPKPDPTMTKS